MGSYKTYLKVIISCIIVENLFFLGGIKIINAQTDKILTIDTEWNEKMEIVDPRIELTMKESVTEWTEISRYILTNRYIKIRQLHPEWFQIDESKRKKLDKNKDEKINDDDLTMLERHMAAIKNKAIRKAHPDWILYEMNDSAIVIQIPVMGITLNKESGTIQVGETEQLIATVNPGNASNKEVNWQSSDANIATVKNGKVMGIGNGIAVITAISKSDPNIKANYYITVQTLVNKIVLDQFNVILDLSNVMNKNTVKLNAIVEPESANVNTEIEWSVKAPDNQIIRIDQQGNITALKNGKAVIMASNRNGINAECTVEVKTSPEKIVLDQSNVILDVSNVMNKNTVKLNATVEPESANVNTEIEWSVKEPDNQIIRIDQQGNITALKSGKAVIVASSRNGINAECTVEVKTSPKKLELNKKNVTLNLIKTKAINLKASIYPNNTDRTLQRITWKTSNKKIATVNTAGVVTLKSPGTVTITAVSNMNPDIKATCKITVEKVYSTSSKTKMRTVKGDGYENTIKLAERTFKLYKQGKGSYCLDHFNSGDPNSTKGYIADMGCGPSSLTIILSGYDSKYDPGDIGRKCTSSAKELRVQGKKYASASIYNMAKVAKKLGRKVKLHEGYNKNYRQVYSQMKEALSKGHQFVLYVGGGSGTTKSARLQFSTGAHFISVLGIDVSNDKVFVGNPGILGTRDNGWFDLSTVVKARGNGNGTMKGWVEIY